MLDRSTLSGLSLDVVIRVQVASGHGCFVLLRCGRTTAHVVTRGGVRGVVCSVHGTGGRKDRESGGLRGKEGLQSTPLSSKSGHGEQAGKGLKMKINKGCRDAE